MSKELTIVCLGDSLTAGGPGFSGYGTFHGNIQSQYEYWLSKEIESHYPHMIVDVANFGVGGNVIWQMVYRYKRDVLRIMSNPDYVIVMGGINDILGHNVTPEEVITDLSELYELIISSGAKVIPMEIAPCTVTNLYVKRIKNANLGIHVLAEKIKVPVVPIYDALTDSTKSGLNTEYDVGDGVHFNVNGYKKIGITVFNSIKHIFE